VSLPAHAVPEAPPSQPPAAPQSPVLHVYDDIQEEDNRLPNWWLGILFGSIVFAFAYFFVYEIARSVPGPLDEFRTELADAAKKRAEAGPVTNESLTVLAGDAHVVADGKRIFASTCAPCHGQQGQGVVGPNLTDKFWLHGGAPVDIHRSITAGYPDKGMQPWAGVLGPARVRSVAAFVVSLKGQNVAGKPPQGTPVE
jgi:cytochrome c oxidase cbb3-type subunit 3